jgi:outer membrane protein assembly factor BamB
MSPLRLIATLMLLTLLAGCQTVGGWFGRGHDPEVSPAPLVEFAATAQAERLWSTRAGRGTDRSRANLPPVFADGEIWVADANGRITAVDADSGREQRSWNTGERVSAGPTVHGDLVFFTTFAGRLHAVDRQSGDSRWQAELTAEVLSMPVIEDGVVVVRGINGRVFGFALNSGERLWVYERSVPLLTLRGTSDPLARAGVIFIGFDDGLVAALRARDGQLLWEERIAEPEGRTELERLADIDGPLAVVGSELYVASYRDRIAGLAVDSGRLLWIKEVSSAQGLSLRRTQLATADRNDAVWLIDRRNSATLWRDDRLARRQITRPVFLGDYLITVDFEGYMHCYDADSGEFAARVRATRNRPVSAPLVVGNQLYVLDTDGHLSAWRVASR